MHRELVGQEAPVVTSTVVIPTEDPEVGAALSAIAGLPAAIRARHPTAESAVQAEPLAKRAAVLPPDPNNPAVWDVLAETLPWIERRRKHLEREAIRYGAATPPGGKLTTAVLGVLTAAWPAIRAGAAQLGSYARAAGPGTLAWMRSHKLLTALGITLGPALPGIWRGARDLGKGLGKGLKATGEAAGAALPLLLILAFLLLKGRH